MHIVQKSEKLNGFVRLELTHAGVNFCVS